VITDEDKVELSLFD
jgi:hypothetical protein